METAIHYYTQEHWNDVGAIRKLDGTACTDALGRSILDRAGPLAGATVLDIACGTGWLARRAAQQGARVIAVDISPVMLGRTRKHSEAVVADDKLGSVGYVACDCARLPHQDEFCDLVLVAKTIWVFPDINACIREWRRLVRPGGRILVQLWGNPRRCSLITAGASVLVNVVPGLRVPEGGVGPFDLIPQTLIEVLALAGFSQFKATRHRMSCVPPSPDDYWTLFGSVAGSAYHAYATRTADGRHQIDEALWHSTRESNQVGGGRRLTLEWWLVTGVAC